MRTIAALLFLSFALPSTALEIRLQPGQKGIYTYEVDARRGLANAMVHNLAILQTDGSPVRLEELTIDLRAGDRSRQTVRYDREELAKAGARMAALDKAGALAMYDFVFQRNRYLPEKTALASSETVAPGSALILNAIPLMVARGVDSMRITARGTDPGGKPVEASLDVPLAEYKQANDYSFPLRGVSAAVGPAFTDPHRWVPSEEFALDIIRVGASGKSCGGTCAKLSDYYAWGTDVFAVADGEVVQTVTDQKESSARLRQPGESSDAFLQRTMQEQALLLEKGVAGVAGNLVSIRHPGGEYSVYAHLAEGSVVVKPGDKVKKGQKIARVGQTGNSTEPHLHFGILDGPDPLYARSLPVRFTGLTTPDGPLPPAYVQSGWLVEAK